MIKLDLKAGGYSWQFVPEAGRTFTDSGTDSCHDANGPVSDSGIPLNGDTPISTPSYTDTNVKGGRTYLYSAVTRSRTARPPVAFYSPQLNNASFGTCRERTLLR